MALPIKYVAGVSTGVPFYLGETRTVVVSAEALSKSSGYKGDSVTYTATVKDNTGVGLPATFVVDLEMGETKVITGQALAPAVYNSATGALTLTFTVPDGGGFTYTVRLVWAEQTI